MHILDVKQICNKNSKTYKVSYHSTVLIWPPAQLTKQFAFGKFLKKTMTSTVTSQLWETMASQYPQRKQMMTLQYLNIAFSEMKKLDSEN